LRSRSNKVNYKVDDTNSAADFESSQEENKTANESSQELRPTTRNNSKRKRAIVEEDQDEEMEEEDAYIQSSRINKKLRGDEDYDLLQHPPNSQIQLQEEMIENAHKCFLCERSDGTILGPFAKKNEPPES